MMVPVVRKLQIPAEKIKHVQPKSNEFVSGNTNATIKEDHLGA